jgi:hypothetical protein
LTLEGLLDVMLLLESRIISFREPL